MAYKYFDWSFYGEILLEHDGSKSGPKTHPKHLQDAHSTSNEPPKLLICEEKVAKPCRKCAKYKYFTNSLAPVLFWLLQTFFEPPETHFGNQGHQKKCIKYTIMPQALHCGKPPTHGGDISNRREWHQRVPTAMPTTCSWGWEWWESMWKR